MKKINSKKGSALSLSKGFTLIELMVVIAIIGVLASVVLASSSTSRAKGADAAIKADLNNARSQAEVFYNTNTAAADSYTNVCTNGTVGGAQGIGSLVFGAAKASGLTGYGVNNVPAATTLVATCNDSATAFAAEVPLKSVAAGQVWCVDSTGKSLARSSSIGAGTACP